MQRWRSEMICMWKYKEYFLGMSWEEERRRWISSHFWSSKKECWGEEVEDGKFLMTRKVILNPEKEAKEPVHRNSLFRTSWKTTDKVWKVIIDSGSTDNIVSTVMVEKLELETNAHPNPYKVSWLQKGHQVMVSKQCQVEFKIGGYKDEILCDVIPMDVCHVLLGRPW